MTLEEFEAKFGKSTDPADLDRANCTLGGTCGHSQCGLCEHGTPRFLKCEACEREGDLTLTLFNDHSGAFWLFVGHPYAPPRPRMDRCRLLARGLLHHFTLNVK